MTHHEATVSHNAESRCSPILSFLGGGGLGGGVIEWVGSEIATEAKSSKENE